MFKHLLVPIDGSKLSLKALDLALTLAPAGETKLTVLHVAPGYPTMVGGDGYMITPMAFDDWDKSVLAQTEKIRKLVEKRAAAKSIAVQFLSVVLDQPFVAIIDAARRKKCDLIVMASHGRGGISALLLGSETAKVLTHCKLPVLVCR